MDLGRRIYLRLLVALSTIVALLPFAAYSGYLTFKPEVKISKKRIANLSQVLRNSAIYFLWPTDAFRDLNILIRDDAGSLHAYNAVCPHASCSLRYDDANRLLVCPCHASMFEPRSGEVVQGPAFTPLVEIRLEQDKDDEIYAVGFAGAD